MRKINEIILHCTDTYPSQDWHVSDIDRCHRKRGFKCIGYHYVICLDGNIEEGRKETAVGAHCVGHNANSIGIVYVGGRDVHGLHDNTLNDAQLNSLCNLLHTLLERYSLTIHDIHCHNEYANKACPCFGLDYVYKVIQPILLNCY